MLFKTTQMHFSFLMLQCLCFHLDPKGQRLQPSSSLDPLMAGLLSVFIVTTAIVFIVLFLKFRQRTNHPEFHRLQDLPMVRCTHSPLVTGLECGIDYRLVYETVAGEDKSDVLDAGIDAFKVRTEHLLLL